MNVEVNFTYFNLGGGAKVQRLLSRTRLGWSLYYCVTVPTNKEVFLCGL